jgi:anti-sigma regulatory factor (Ser/Thr protein kinase)
MVTLSMIADQDYLALARTSATHVGSLLWFPLARVADLRLAVNEACVCFLDPAARRESAAHGIESAAHGMSPRPNPIELAYDRHPSELHVSVRAAVGENWPEVDDLGWALLRALVGDVRVEVRDGVGVLTLIQPLPTGED